MKSVKRSTQFAVVVVIISGLFTLLGFQNCAPPQKPAAEEAVMAGNLAATVPHPTFTFTVSDPGNYLGANKTLFLNNAIAAGKLWAVHFNSSVNLNVKIEVAQSESN